MPSGQRVDNDAVVVVVREKDPGSSAPSIRDSPSAAVDAVSTVAFAAQPRRQVTFHLSEKPRSNVDRWRDKCKDQLSYISIDRCF